MDVFVKCIFLVCCWSGIMQLKHDFEYKVGIKLCAQRCFQTGSCTNIKLDSKNLHCQLSIEKIKRYNSSLIKQYPSVWKHVPHHKCEENQRLVLTRTRGPVCVSDPFNRTSSSNSSLTPGSNTSPVPGELGPLNSTRSGNSTITSVDNTTPVPVLGKSGVLSQTVSSTPTRIPVNYATTAQDQLTSTSSKSLVPQPVNITTPVPARGASDKQSRTRSKYTTVKPVNITTPVKVLEEPAGPLNPTRSGNSTITSVDNTTPILVLGKSDQLTSTSSKSLVPQPVNITTPVPARGASDKHSRTRSKYTTVKPVNITTPAKVLEEPAAHQKYRCSGNKCSKKRSVCQPGGPCVCKVGFHYDPKRNKCLTVCRKFGTSMVYYKGTGLDAHNDHIFRKITLEECARRCTTFTIFLCKSFDYGREFDIGFMPKACYLSKVAYFEVPEKERNTGKHWIMGVRDCES